MKKIVLTGGGTAGHVYPALALAEKLTDYEIHYFGGNGIEKEILKKEKNITYHEVPVVKFERRVTCKNFLIPIKLFRSIRLCKKELKKISPCLVFSKGGFVALPVTIAAKKLGVPVVSHESDLSLGLANKIILKFCVAMCTTFEQTSKNHKCVFTGQPIRDKIFHGKKIYTFNNSKPTLLILGGSLGAKFLNDFVYENLDELLKHFNILHITGKNKKDIRKTNYVSTDFAENIEDFYASADIALSRSGSGVISELLALHIPMLLVPLSKKSSRGDQIENAKLFEKLGYAKMIEEENVSLKNVMEKLLQISKNEEKIVKNMKKTAKNRAKSEILGIIKKYELK